MRRFDSLDVAKGIGIALVVYAHASAPYSSVMYEFHMPLFFLISGWLHNNHISSGEFFFRKLKSLYIPFIFWNIASVVLMSFVGAYSFSATQVGNMVFGILATFNKDGIMFGATWFLGALFFISVLFKIVEDAIGNCSQRPFLLLLIFIAIGYYGFRATLDWMLSRTLILGVFYAIGYFLRHMGALYSEGGQLLGLRSAY